MNGLSKENKMGTMPIGRLLASMSWPAILSMLIQALYNIVDSMFVAMICEDALSAVTYAYPIQMFMVSFAVGTGVGVNSLISRRIGANRISEAISAANHSIRLALMNWIIFAAFGIFFAKGFLTLFTDSTYILEGGTDYLRIVTIGSFFVMISVTIEKLFQSTGNMKLPMLCSLLGAITNIILDPIFIFGLLGMPKMGLAGAAIATVIGQALGCLLAVILIIKNNHTFHISLRHFKLDMNIIKDIYAVGLPGIVMQSIGSVMIIGLNGILATHSETAVAVLGAYFKLQSFVFMPVFGLSQGSMPIMGFNFGARNKKRLMKTYKCALTCSVIYMAIGFTVFQTVPELLLKIFNASEGMLEIGIPALRLISLCFIPAAFGISCTNIFQATGHGMLSLFSSLIRQLVGILPIAWLLMRYGGVKIVWAAFPLAEILGIIYVAIGLAYILKKEIKPMQERITD